MSLNILKIKKTDTDDPLFLWQPHMINTTGQFPVVVFIQIVNNK